ncbi:MAG: hypothetical protein SH820_08610 [Xanthomonadales bacterium]|nr:hypothetical protein [Xanthomonadales bacterium]
MECVLRRVLCGLLLVTPVVQADVFAGKSGQAVASNTLMRFTDGQSGDVAPAGTFGGPLSGLISVGDMAYLHSSKELYVSDFWGQAIRVYDQLSGDAAPVRTISGAQIGQPRQLVLIPEHSEVMVITSQSNSVSTFALDAKGEVGVLRRIGVNPNPVSGLTNPSGLAYNPATDEIYVGDYHFDGVNYHAEILVFPRTANGDVAPSRVITGSNTLLGTYTIDLDFNALNNEIYALTDSPVAFDEPYILSTFSAMASGNVAPLRRITGASTGLYITTGLDFDAENNQLIVASHAYNSLTLPGLLFFPRTANGNVAPSKIIRGAQTGTSLGNDGWSSVLAVDLSFIFASGFE